MNVQFGSTTDDVAVINKTYNLGSPINCQVKAGTSIENPTIIVKYNSIDTTANYAYIADFERFYFVGDKTFVTGNRVEVNLSVDPLTSFKDGLNSCEFYIERIGTQGERAAFLSDSNYPMTSETVTTNLDFSETPFVTVDEEDFPNYVLTVVGGSKIN